MLHQAHPEGQSQLQGQDIIVKGYEADVQLPRHYVAIHSLLLEDALACYGPPRQEVDGVLYARSSLDPDPCRMKIIDFDMRDVSPSALSNGL